MKGVQCYELFGGIALKNHTFFIFIFFHRLVLFSNLDMFAVILMKNIYFISYCSMPYIYIYGMECYNCNNTIC